MYGIVLAIHVIICFLLIAVILMQQKGGGMSSIFGGGESVFGGRGANPFLTKTTVVLFILFAVISLSLVLMTRGKQETKKSAIKKAVESGEVAPPQPYGEE